MAFEFNAILKFNSTGAEKGLTSTRNQFTKLQSSISKAGLSLNQIGQGTRSAALATAPLAIGLGGIIAQATNFESQLSTVRSVSLATEAEMVQLNSITKQLGATTSFTAKQAGEAAESLARSGFNASKIVDALPGVLNAAEASGTDLATTASIVVSQLGSFGLEASKASKVADTLSLTTALTNTDMIELGEALKFVAPIAKNAKISFEETASSIGILANAGVRGSLAGTALKNAILKLSKPSKEAIKLFGSKEGLAKATLETVEINGKLVQRLKPFEAIMANVSKVVAKSKNPLEATATAAEIFGLRGSTAFGAFSSKLQETIPITDKMRSTLISGAKNVGENIDEFLEKGSIPTLVALRLQIAGATGTASKMAAIKLDNVKGQFTLLQSAVSGLAIEVGGLFLGPLKDFLKTSAEFFSVLAIGFQKAVSGTELTGKALEQLNKNRFKDLLISATEFAKGFIEGFNEIKDSAQEIFNDIKNFLKPIIGSSDLTAASLGKIASKVLILGAVASPILAGIGAAFFILGPIITGVVGFFNLMTSSISIVVAIAKIGFGIISAVIGTVSAPLLGVIAAVAAVTAAIFIFEKEITSAFSFVGKKALSLFTSFVGFARPAINLAKNLISSFANFVVQTINPIVGIFGDVWSSIKELTSSTFEKISNIISITVRALSPIFRFFGAFVQVVFSEMVEGIKTTFRPVGVFFTSLWNGVFDVTKSMFEGIKTFSLILFNSISNIFSPLTNFFADLWNNIVSSTSESFDNLKSSVFSPLIVGLKSSFKSLGGFILDVLTAPLRGILSLVKDLLGSLAGTTLGRKALSVAGLDIDSFQKSLNQLPNLTQNSIDSISSVAKKTTPTVKPSLQLVPDFESNQNGNINLAPQNQRAEVENRRIVNASLKQKSLSTPPNEEQLVAAVRRDQRSQNSGGNSQGGPMQLTGTLETKISGKDLNIILSRAMVDNAELNGRTISPLEKRRAIQNGASFGAA